MVSIGNFIKRIAGSHGRHLERDIARVADDLLPAPLCCGLTHRGWISSSFIVEILQFLSRHIWMKRGGSVRSHLFDLDSVRLEYKPLDPTNNLPILRGQSGPF